MDRRRWALLWLAAHLAGVPATGCPAAGAEEVAPLRVIAIGASNTSGWGVGDAAAYPARLEALLRACGHRVQVVNAGVPFETTNGMLRRIDQDVPDGTRAVVIQPGGNDLRFFGTIERRTANIEAMAARLRERGIVPVVYDPVFPPEAYQWDRIHLTAEAHARIAEELAPEIAEAIAPPPRQRSASRPSQAEGIRAAAPCAKGPPR